MPTNSRSLVLAAILLSVFLSALEATVVATAMPTAVADLHGIELYGWVGSAYMLATTVTIPLWGKSADVWGRKPAMLAGLVFFLAGSLGCGLAGSMLALVGARVVQGIGAGALQPVALTLVGDLFRLEERGRVQGALGAVWGIAGMLGPLVGGLLVRWLSWRWVFYINLPFGLLSGLLLGLFLREPVRAPGARPSLDVAGALLLAAGVVALLLGLGGHGGPLVLPLAGALLLAFVLVERRTREPLVPVALLGQRSIIVACVTVGLLGMVMLGEVTFLPLYVQSARGGSPTEGGLAVAPMLIGWPVASTFAGRLLPRVGPRILVRTGHLLIALGTAGGFLVILSGAPLPLAGASMVVLGAGMGLVNTSLVIAVQEGAPAGQRGVATALTVFFRSIGSALGLGALGALLARRLAGVLDEAALGALLSRDRPGAALLPPGAAGLVDHALQPLFGALAALGLLALLVGLSYPRSSLDPAPAPR